MTDLSGEHIRKVTPVPIPNTEVKLSEPMIVHTSVKVGIAGFLKTPVDLVSAGVFSFSVSTIGDFRYPGFIGPLPSRACFNLRFKFFYKGVVQC